ncbi:MAG: hypothetical protein EOP54_00265 [Sphingobacteriales bacterium]|nr:MAG: hypothetical protein EOP54_00265 [Sphingobacteriales bacterium]
MKPSFKHIVLGVLSISTLSVAGCYKDNAEEMYPPAGGGSTCETSNVTFSNTVNTIIATKCATAGCHAGVYPTGIDLSDYAGVATIANSGKLMASITHSGSASAMPKGLPKLDDCSIAKIKKWVDDGAPNN